MDLFQDILKAARSRAGLGQWECSKKAGISRGLLSLIETGKRTPPLEKLEAIGRALNLDGPELNSFIQAGHADHATDFLRQEIAELREDLRQRDAILGTGEPVEVSASDLKLCKGDEALPNAYALRTVRVTVVMRGSSVGRTTAL